MTSSSDKSLRTVYTKLETLASTSSKNEKVSLLRDYLDDPLFLKVVQYALDETKHYNIKKFPQYKPSFHSTSVEKIFAQLDKLSQKQGASDADKQLLISYAHLDPETFEVVRRICRKDLRCGVSTKLINKARPGTIRTVPYLRCSTHKHRHRLIYPAIAQEKADGTFCYVIITKKKKVFFITRKGQRIFQLNDLRANIKQKITPEFHSSVFAGEIVVYQDGEPLPRRTSNAIIHQAIRKTADPEEIKNAVLFIWDYIPLKDFTQEKCTIPYKERFEKAKEFVKLNSYSNIQVIPYEIVNSWKEANKFYLRMRENGKEGAVVKNFKAIWKDGTSTEQIKLKNTSDAELRIVGWLRGQKGTKYEDCMGALICKTDDKLVTVKVGTGFEDDDRFKNWNNYVGKIISIEYEAVIQNKKGEYSLYLPRFKEVRFDRDTTDTLEELLHR